VLQKERIKIRRRNGAKTISHQEEFEDTKGVISNQ
jgi:hypothetical protein